MPFDSKINNIIMDFAKMINIKVISDTICPWCYIGKKELDNAISLLSEINFSITYKPFQLDPTMPPQGVNRRKYIERKFGEDTAKEVGLKITEAGIKVGINFNYEKIEITPNTLDSHRLIRWAERENKQTEALDLLFYSYFTEGLNIGDKNILLNLAEKLKLNTQEIKNNLDSDIDRKEIELEEWSYRDLGIAGVPTYIINEDLIVTGSQSSDTFVKLFNRIT